MFERRAGAPQNAGRFAVRCYWSGGWVRTVRLRTCLPSMNNSPCSAIWSRTDRAQPTCSSTREMGTTSCVQDRTLPTTPAVWMR